MCLHSDKVRSAVWGAVIGDIVGSRFEHANHRSKDFELFGKESRFTDDTAATLAVAKALVEAGGGSDDELRRAVVRDLCAVGRRFPYVGWGGMFRKWFSSDDPQPYGSFGNGAAMRVSPVGEYAASEEEVKRLSRIVTGVSHSHPEGLKGAECVALCVYLARTGADKEEIFRRVRKEYYPEIADISCAELSENYFFDVTCQGSVPQAIRCFYEGTDYEDTIRNAVSVGGDSDTIAAVAGGIAGAYYGVPQRFIAVAALYLPDDLRAVAERFGNEI